MLWIGFGTNCYLIGKIRRSVSESGNSVFLGVTERNQRSRIDLCKTGSPKVNKNKSSTSFGFLYRYVDSAFPWKFASIVYDNIEKEIYI